MAKERLNLVTTIRELLEVQGYSSVLVVNAVNAALGSTSHVGTTIKLGDSTVTKTTYKVSERETRKYEGKRNGALDLDAFNSSIAKIEKKFGILKLAEFPAEIKDWLERHPKFKAGSSDFLNAETEIETETEEVK